MIQRIQTLYLFLTGALMLATLFFPLVTFGGEALFKMDARQLSDETGAILFSTVGLFFIGMASVLMAMVTIFLYKKRVLQIRLTLFNTLLIIAFIAYAVYLGFCFEKQFDVQWSPGLALSLPVLCIVFNILAIRGIRADEALIRSLDRLR